MSESSDLYGVVTLRSERIPAHSDSHLEETRRFLYGKAKKVTWFTGYEKGGITMKQRLVRKTFSLWFIEGVI